jgi:glycosyltransferase involved in cell wall biosynthesis
VTGADERTVLMVVEQLRRAVPGGIGTYARGVLQGFAQGAAVDEVVAVSLHASRRPRRRGESSIRASDPLEGFGFPLLASRLPGPLLTRAWDRGRAPAPAGFDVVHSVSLAFPPPAQRGGGSTTLTVHDLSWRRFPEATTRRGRQWHEAALRRALLRADAFVVPSDMVADELIAAGAAAPQVTVIPAGTDHLPEPDHAAASQLLRDLGVRDQYLLTVSTVEPRKNLPRLFAAYERARRELPGAWPLVVVGPRGWGSAATQRPPQGILPAGQVADPVLAGLYARARAFVYVPLTEGYGLPPLEAMVFGVPVVASTEVPSVVPRPTEPPEAVALRVDAHDVDAIAGALVTACADGAHRADLVTAGRVLATERTWRRAAARHAEVWKAVG